MTITLTALFVLVAANTAATASLALSISRLATEMLKARKS